MSKTPQIHELLLAGCTPEQAAQQLGCTPRWVYQVARRDKLPTNPPIKENGPAESEILRLHFRGIPLDEIAQIFSHSVQSIQALLNKLGGSDEEGVHDRSGRQGEAPASLPEESSNAGSIRPAGSQEEADDPTSHYDSTS